MLGLKKSIFRWFRKDGNLKCEHALRTVKRGKRARANYKSPAYRRFEQCHDECDQEERS